MNRQKPLTLSIVIPAYNEEHHLKACLDSIAKQTVKPDEVIVVDNNSTDRTAKIAKSYEFVSLISESRQGIVFARNAGFNACHGDIICRIDADTILPPNWMVDRVYFYSQSTNRQIAWTGGGVYYNVRLPRLFRLIHHFLVFKLNGWIMHENILWGSNMTVPRKLWQKVQPKLCTRVDIHEDIDMAIHLHRLGYKIVHEPKSTVQVKLRRVRSHRQDLWANLQWWPRTLKVHKYRGWVFSWLFGAAMVYCLSEVPKMMERMARIFGRKPILE